MTERSLRLPCESLVVKIFGERWREMLPNEIDGALGVSVVRSVLDGVHHDLHNLSSHLGVTTDMLRSSFTRLNLNGVFLRDRIYNDRKALNQNDIHAWCQYAGIASGATGYVQCDLRKKRS